MNCLTFSSPRMQNRQEQTGVCYSLKIGLTSSPWCFIYCVSNEQECFIRLKNSRRSREFLLVPYFVFIYLFIYLFILTTTKAFLTNPVPMEITGTTMLLSNDEINIHEK